MKNTKRILCAILAMVLLLSVMLTGCKKPQITFNQIPGTAATYGNGQELTTGQYLAYLYLEFENIYYNQGLYQYEYYGMDPWTQEFPYGDSDEKLLLADYILRATQDNIKRQIVLEQLLKDNGISWMADEQAELEKGLASMEKDAYLALGINNESYGYALKNANLNERAAFYGLYGIGGKHANAAKEDEVKTYFADNYVSYKAISIPLTDSNNKELDKEGEAYQKLMDLMKGYMDIYENEGFLAAYEQYEKDATTISDIQKAAATTTTTVTTTSGTNATANSGSTTTAAATTTTTTTVAATTSSTEAATTTTGTGTTTGTATTEEEEHEHDHSNLRQNVDSTSMDEALKDVILGKKDKDGKVEIEAIEVGKCEIVEYKAGGSTPTLAMIERLDINKDDEGKEGAVYENEIENIIYTLKYEEFDKDVKADVAELKITFNEKVTKHKECQPQYFLEIINNL